MAAERKYEFTDETQRYGDVTLHRIRALRSFGDVAAGALGGWIERDGEGLAGNLEHDGLCWVDDDAKVFGICARVSGDGLVSGQAVVTGRASIKGHVTDAAMIDGRWSHVIVASEATVGGVARISEGLVRDNARGEPKYEFAGETMDHDGVELHRIRAVKDFGEILAGDLGGWVETPQNLDHAGDCWVADEAKVFGLARVEKNASVREQGQVFDAALVTHDAVVEGRSMVFERAKVEETSYVGGQATVCGTAEILNEASVLGEAHVAGGVVCDSAEVTGRARVLGPDCVVSGFAKVKDQATVMGRALVEGSVTIADRAVVRDQAIVSGVDITIGGSRTLQGREIERGGEEDPALLPRHAREMIDRAKSQVVAGFETRQEMVLKRASEVRGHVSASAEGANSLLERSRAIERARDELDLMKDEWSSIEDVFVVEQLAAFELQAVAWGASNVASDIDELRRVMAEPPSEMEVVDREFWLALESVEDATAERAHKVALEDAEQSKAAVNLRKPGMGMGMG